MNLTPEEHRRIWPETRPLIDLFLEQDGLSAEVVAKPVPAGVPTQYDLEFAVASEMLRGRYTLRTRVDDRDWYAGEYVGGSLFGINASSYKLWAEGVIQFESDLAKLDEWDMQQEEVPVAIYARAEQPIGRPLEHPIVLSGSPQFEPGDWVTIAGASYPAEDVFRGDWNPPPGVRVRSVDVERREITLEAVPAEPGGVVLSGSPRRPPEQPRGRVPAHVHRHRARLDGRRMR